MAAIAKGTPVKFIYSATAASVPATPSAGVFYVFQNGDLWLNTDGTASGNVQIGIPKSRKITAGDGLAGGGTLTGDVTVSHSTAAGYKHIPAGGAAGNILVYGGSAGTAAWAAPTTLSVSHAATADKTKAAITITLNGGTTEGTNKFVFDGSAAKAVNITPSGIGAALANHNHDGIYAPINHDHMVDDITDFPTTLPNPHTLSILLEDGEHSGGTTGGKSTMLVYDGSSEKSLTITATSVGATPESHQRLQATSNTLGHVQVTAGNGLSITSGTIAMAAANGSTAGAVTGGAQTFDGAKTFNGAIYGKAGGSFGAPIAVGTPTADSHATTKTYVDSKINSAIAAQNAMVFKGIVNTATALPTTGYKVGWTYYVGTAGTYAGEVCEVGDMIICVKNHATGASNADWNAVQTNINGAVVGATDLTENQVVVGSGSKNVKILPAGTNGYVLTMVDGNPAWQTPGHVQPSTIAPKAPGTATVGTETTYARADHVHPLQTTVATATSANQLTTARTIALSGTVTGSASFNGSTDITIATTIGNIEIDDGDLDTDLA